MTNVIEMPRREAWVATYAAVLPESLRNDSDESLHNAAAGALRGLAANLDVIDHDPIRDVAIERGTNVVLTLRFEVSEASASVVQSPRFQEIVQTMPGVTCTVERSVWERSKQAPKALVDFERWHPRCVALLDVLADSDHPEADAERYAVLEMLRDVVRKVV